MGRKKILIFDNVNRVVILIRFLVFFGVVNIVYYLDVFYFVGCEFKVV